MNRLISFSTAIVWCSTAALSVAAPATQPDAAALHAQAVEAFRDAKISAAATLMEKAYAATPPELRSRPLVLNRAIIDLTQRTYAMRAARELADYLRVHDAYDEKAHDILGAALDVAARSPRVKRGDAWQAAYAEWERRDAQMSVTRPGYRRWGPEWLDDAQYARLQAGQQDAQRAVDDQSLRVDRAAARVGSLSARQQAARDNDLRARQQLADNWNQQRTMRSQWEKYQRDLDDYPARKAAYDQWVKKQQARGKPLPPGVPTEAPPPPTKKGNIVYLPPTAMPTPAGGADSEYARLAGDLYAAQQELKAERDKLIALQAQLARSNRPSWPTTFEPIELTETQAPPPLPPDPKAVAAIGERIEREAHRARTVFGEEQARPPAASQGAKDVTVAAGSRPEVVAPTTAPVAASQVPFGPREVDSKKR